MNSENIYLFCVKFFETLHPNFCSDTNELENNKVDHLLPDSVSTNEIICPDTFLITDEEKQDVIFIDSDTREEVNDCENKSTETLEDKPDLCSCTKQIGLFLRSNFKKSD